MALRATMRGSVRRKAELDCALDRFIRWSHGESQSPSMQSFPVNIATPPLKSPENQSSSTVFTVLPRFSSIGVGSMELMAVPRKKVSPHKKGIRNGPKALKPVPVIIRCKVCGRVKLPHFYCCSGIKPNPSS